jgi:hypothetical protein
MVRDVVRAGIGDAASSVSLMMVRVSAAPT